MMQSLLQGYGRVAAWLGACILLALALTCGAAEPLTVARTRQTVQRWPVRVDWDCFVVRLRLLDARGRDMTVLPDEACAGSPPVILWPGEVRRADPLLPVLDGHPGGRYRLRAELDVAGLRAAHEATLDWRP